MEVVLYRFQGGLYVGLQYQSAWKLTLGLQNWSKVLWRDSKPRCMKDIMMQFRKERLPLREKAKMMS